LNIAIHKYIIRNAHITLVTEIDELGPGTVNKSIMMKMILLKRSF